MARADAAALGDDGLVLELRKVGYLECFELLGCGFDLLHPTPVELVPVLVVVAAAPREELGPPLERRLVRDRVCAVVDVPVEDAILDAQGRRDDEQTCARLVERDDGRVDGNDIERVHAAPPCAARSGTRSDSPRTPGDPRRRESGRGTSPPSPRSRWGPAHRTGSGSQPAPARSGRARSSRLPSLSLGNQIRIVRVVACRVTSKRGGRAP